MNNISIEKALEMAMEEHRAGHFQRAQDMYVAIMQQDPGNVDCIHLLGVLANQGKRPDVGIEFIGRAIRERPTEPVFHYNYADCLAVLDRWPEAIESLERAVELNKDYYEAWINLANAYGHVGRWEDSKRAAEEAYELADDPSYALNNIGNAERSLGNMDAATEALREALQENPGFPEAANNLGMCLAQTGKVEEAIPYYKEAIRLMPTNADFYNNLGVAYLRLARRDEAAEMLHLALKLRPDFPQAENNLGVCLRDSGRPEEAIVVYKKVLEKQPEAAEIWNNLSTTYRDLARIDDAKEAARKAIELNPDFGGAHFSLSAAYHSANELDLSIEHARRAVELEPENPGGLSSLGYKLIERGDVEEGLEYVRQSLAIFPDPHVYSNALLAVNYLENYTPQQVCELHREWGQLQMQMIGESDFAFAGTRDQDRKLKIGYVSPDLRMHSVMTFAESFLAHHDKSEFEITCYSTAMRPDPKTLQARVYADRWREAVGWSDEELIRRIREDGIDILVELAGHTAGNSLSALARRGAPIQISGIGYPCTTGLPTMDYRITDAYCDPPETAVELNSEKLLYLDPSFWCYHALEEAPPVAELPADRNGHVTFATVNNFAKVMPQVQALWARLLAAIPGSRFIMQSAGTGSEHARVGIIRRFEEAGVSADRLDLRGHTSMYEFLKLFDEVDVVLDPFPFNGGTTTCHHMWMGAPIITLAGGLHAGRMGVSLLSNVGLQELVAHSHEDYIRIAVELAGDLPRLREIRRTLRDRMESSALRDEAGYTRRLESAYRRVWREFCASG